MRDRDIGQGLVHERTFTPEEYASLLEIVSWANQSVELEYKGVPKLEAQDIKVFSEEGFADFAIAMQEAWLHPFFKETARQKAKEKGIQMQFGIETDCIVDPYANMVYLRGDYINDMQQDKDKKVGYLRTGITLINKAFESATKPLVLEIEDAQELARRIVATSYEEMRKEAGIGSQEQQETAIAYLNEKGSHIHVKGAVIEVIVEELRFIPPIGLRSDAAVINYLAKPVRRNFARLLSNEFSLPLNQRWNYEQVAEITGVGTNLSEVMQNPGVVREESDRERAVLETVRTIGFRGRQSILSAYLGSEIGKRMVENL